MENDDFFLLYIFFFSSILDLVIVFILFIF
nr:MAG TPA: hypothetical protein [Ackermannviridae sp.]